MGDTSPHKGPPSTWSGYEARGEGEEDLASLPEAVQAIIEECRAQKSNQTSAAAAVVAAEAPYPCRMYEEAEPGEEDELQLQWMRVDVRGSKRVCRKEFDGCICADIKFQTESISS